MTGKRNLWKVAAALEAWFSSFALIRVCGLETTGIFSLVFFFFCFQIFLLGAGREREDLLTRDGHRLVLSLSAAKRRKASAALGLFFALLCPACERETLTEGLTSPLFQAVSLLFCAAGFFFLFFRGSDCSFFIWKSGRSASSA